MYVAVALGYVAGVAAAFVLGRRVVVLAARGIQDPEHRRTIVRGGVAGGIIALVPALLLGAVIAGTLGSSIGERLAPSRAGIAAALAIGEFAVVCFTITVATAAGAMLGNLVGKR